MRTVWIVQPYVPRYRVALFEGLMARLQTDGVQLRVAAGRAEDSRESGRGDEARPTWLEEVEWTYVGPARISHARRLYRGADAVIFPHEASNTELLAAQVARILGGSTRIGLWGHIRTYVNDPNPLAVGIERWQLRHADGVFAYTDGGARFARDAGVPAEKIVTLNNTVDTVALRSAIEALDDGAVREFQVRHRLVPARTIAYIGGLDESKRIDMLADVLDLLWESHPEVRLVVGGQGRSAGLLDRAEARDQVVRLGYADARLKALLAATAQLIVNPGRIGLLAVDALVMGLPLVTTPWPYHAPEIEYLDEGRTVYTSADDARSFARLVSTLLTDGHPRAAGSTSNEAPQLGDLVARFADGILGMLAQRV